jgi:hypothetical protein
LSLVGGEGRVRSDLYFTMDGAGEADSSRFSQVWSRVTDDNQAGPSQEDALTAFVSAETVLLVDWIGPETPSTIASIAPVVYGKIGPKPDDWALVDAEGSSFKATRGSTPGARGSPVPGLDVRLRGVRRRHPGPGGRDVLVPLGPHPAALPN